MTTTNQTPTREDERKYAVSLPVRHVGPISPDSDSRWIEDAEGRRIAVVKSFAAEAVVEALNLETPKANLET